MLKIKDKLYKYSFMAGFMEYEVYEVRQQENNVLYAVRCQQCRDHDKCELLIRKPKEYKTQKYYEFVCMLNNNDEDDKEQYYWHDTFDKHYYWENKNDAILAEYKKLISDKEQEIFKDEEHIKKAKDKIQEINVLISNLVEKVSDGNE